MEDIFCMKFHLSSLEERGDKNALFAFSVFQVPFAQNNTDAEVAYCGLAYSATLLMLLSESNCTESRKQYARRSMYILISIFHVKAL